MFHICKEKDLKIYFDKKPLTDFDPKGNKKKPFVLLNRVFCYVVYKGVVYVFLLEKGYRWDGATIPALLRPIIGSKTDEKFKIPSMIHDKLCENHSFINNDVELSSEIFEKALLYYDVPPWKASAMHFAVNNWQKAVGGWNLPTKQGVVV